MEIQASRFFQPALARYEVSFWSHKVIECQSNTYRHKRKDWCALKHYVYLSNLSIYMLRVTVPPLTALTIRKHTHRTVDISS